MLVLSRKDGQQIVIPGAGITVKVIDIQKGRVRLGVTAPGNQPVHRDEVWKAIQKGDGRPCNRQDRTGDGVRDDTGGQGSDAKPLRRSA